MKIAIEARALSASEGVRTYVTELTTHLLRHFPDHEYTLIYSDARRQAELHGARAVTLPLRHRALLPLWQEWQLPGLLNQLNPDIVHFTKSAVPRYHRQPRVVTIHDIIPILFPHSQPRTKRLLWPRTIQYAATHSDHVITVSEQSKQDISSYFHIHPDNITATPEAVDTTFFRPTQAPLPYTLHKPYLLFLGTIEPRKNIPSLVAAFNRLAKDIPHDLVIAGKMGHQHQRILEAVQSSPFEQRIRVLERVPYKYLPALYSGADLFVWPSVYEGWGLPAHEAMACGTPVIVSDGGSLPEVVGDAAEIVPFTVSNVRARTNDQDFIAALTDRMLHVLNSPEKKQDMRAKGLARVQKFSWSDTAKRTMAVYQKIANT